MNIKVIFAGLLVSVFTSLAQADAPAKAAMCASCHGKKGISASEQFPSLACQKSAYLEKQLKDFKSGERKDAMMAGFAKQLSDADMKDLAVYYSSIKCSYSEG